MDKPQKKNSKRRKFIRRVRLKTIFFLVLMMATNSFAWFVYTTKVSNSITAKVRSWQVSFEVGGGSETAEEMIEINVDAIYPGMPLFEKKLNVTNNGDTDAIVSFQVISASVLGENLMLPGITTDNILTSLKNDYPFCISLDVSNPIIKAGGGLESVIFNVTWPFDSGNDLEDTKWGNLAYDYHKINPDKPSITLLVKIIASQVNTAN